MENRDPICVQIKRAQDPQNQYSLTNTVDPICLQIKGAELHNLPLKTLSLHDDEEDDYGQEANHHYSAAAAAAEAAAAPIVSSYNDRIRPVLDAVDKLRNLMVMEEGIELPTIVVVGDQSSGKSSVLESLARISLPRGQGICTRVPLVMRLQNHSNPEPELFLEYNKKIVPTTEESVSEAINLATEEIAGNGKGISKTPLTLTVKKQGVPDLTMVDLPGITRVAVRDQPEDIYDQIRDIIMEYIKPEASIVLNVLSATVDFPTCESIKMSQSVDKNGERTLAVVTKCDKSPEGLLEKVMADDVNIGLGYICVRNRIGDESYEEARQKEAVLFRSHPLLSKIDRSIVGVPVLAQKLMQIQAKSITRNFPNIVKKISDKLNESEAELDKVPKTISSDREAMGVFAKISILIKGTLEKLLLRGEFDEFEDEKRMHSTARFVEMLNEYSDNLHDCEESDRTRNFLTEEIKHLEESRKISLPNFLPHTVFLAILQKKVNGIKSIPMEFVEKLWDYIQEVVIRVVLHHMKDYNQLHPSARRACLSLIEKMKKRSAMWMREIVEMEELTDYTCDSDYEDECNKMMNIKDDFIDRIESSRRHMFVSLDGFGEFEVEHLREYSHDLLSQAFDLRMRMVAYWRIVLKRLVDSMALHLQLSVRKLVNKELEEILSELMGPHGNGIEKLMEESPSVATKRAKLTATINKLKESKEILDKIVD